MATALRLRPLEDRLHGGPAAVRDRSAGPDRDSASSSLLLIGIGRQIDAAGHPLTRRDESFAIERGVGEFR